MLVIHMLGKVVATTPIVRAKPENYVISRARPKVCAMVWTRPDKQTKKDAVDKPQRQHQPGRLDRPKIERQPGMAGTPLTGIDKVDTQEIQQ